jgi:hypothetical protein
VLHILTNCSLLISSSPVTLQIMMFFIIYYLNFPPASLRHLSTISISSLSSYFVDIDSLYRVKCQIPGSYISVLPVTVCLFLAQQPPVDQGLLILEVSRLHTTTHDSRQDSSGRVINSSQRPLLDNTQHSQQTNIHALGGIRSHSRSKRATADLRLRPRGHWVRLP